MTGWPRDRWPRGDLAGFIRLDVATWPRGHQKTTKSDASRTANPHIGLSINNKYCCEFTSGQWPRVGGLPLPVARVGGGRSSLVVGFGAFSPYEICMLCTNLLHSHGSTLNVHTISPERRGGLTRVPRRPGRVRSAGRTHDDQGVKEEMMQMVMWAHINCEMRMSARSAYSVEHTRSSNVAAHAVQRCTPPIQNVGCIACEP
jgi:hypothetical protein